MHEQKRNLNQQQQDNDPKHTANVIKKDLQCKEEQEVLEVMVRPPQSSDLNIMESVWDYIKRQKDLRKPISTSLLFMHCILLIDENK